MAIRICKNHLPHCFDLRQWPDNTTSRLAGSFDNSGNVGHDNHADQTHLCLSVRTSTGVEIPAAGVAILDVSPEAGSEAIEINVLGVPYPLYEQLFPQHVLAYHKLHDGQT